MTRALIVLPVLNEETVLERNARALAAWCAERLQGFDWRVLVADNGSVDRTLEVATALTAADGRFSVMSIPQRGRGRALSLAWTRALGTADILAYMDIDLSADLEALPALLGAVAEGADVAYGSRFESGSSVERSFIRETTSRGYRLLAAAVLGVRARDLQCGFKAVSASAWERLRDRVTHPGWFFDTELLLWAERLGMRTVAIPVAWVETRDRRRKSTVRLARTIFSYVGDVARMRWRLWREPGARSQGKHEKL